MSADSISVRLAGLPRDQLLPLALKLDAVVTGANGVAYLALAGPLGDLFDLPVGFVRAMGAFLAVFAVAVWVVALRPRPGAAAVIAANVSWVLASFALVVFDLHEPSTAGVLWTALQALVVTLFVALQAVGLRQAS
jgi:hypothetical protein